MNDQAEAKSSVVSYCVVRAGELTHEATNDGVDRDQLSSMAKQAREAMGVEELSAVAGGGYFNGEEILACHEAGITVFVPKTLTSGATAAGRFGKGDFI